MSKYVSCHKIDQSEADTIFWYHGTVFSEESFLLKTLDIITVCSVGAVSLLFLQTELIDTLGTLVLNANICILTSSELSNSHAN